MIQIFKIAINLMKIYMSYKNQKYKFLMKLSIHSYKTYFIIHYFMENFETKMHKFISLF